jgi:hypothetical protein
VTRQKKRLGAIYHGYLCGFKLILNFTLKILDYTRAFSIGKQQLLQWDGQNETGLRKVGIK